MTTIKKILIYVLLPLVSCALDRHGSNASAFENLQIFEKQSQKSKTQIEPFAEETVARVSLFAEDSFLDCFSSKDNKLFSPVSYAINDAVAQADFAFVNEIDQGLCVLNDRYQSKIDNAIACPGTIPYSKEEIEEYQSNSISIYGGDFLELSAFLEQKYGINVPLQTNGATFINQVQMKDCFFNPWKVEQREFCERETEFAHEVTECELFEDDAVLICSFNVWASSFWLMMAKEGHTLSETNLLEYDNVSLTRTVAHLHVPEFSIDNCPSDEADERWGRHVMQTSSFSFSSFGVSGESTTANAPTSSDMVYPDVILSRPFVFECSVAGLPLFLGRLQNLP